MDHKKINIITLGCSKNVVDSEKLLKQLDYGGYTVSYDPEEKACRYRYYQYLRFY